MTDLELTMVAFHGTPKPEPLTRLLADVRSALGSMLTGPASRCFESYAMPQIHATLIGMEADVVGGHLYGRWLRKNRQESREISIDRAHRVISELMAAGGPLFTIRFGGFPECFCTCRTEHRNATGDWPCASAPQELGMFHSCDRTPFEGSFYALAPGPIMITGWPIARWDEPASFTHGLYQFRKSLEPAGFGDKYHYDTRHQNAHWKNDDCFMRIGTFREAVPLETLSAIQHALRMFLSNMKPVVVDITPADVSIVWYANPLLEDRHVLASIPLPRFVSDPFSVKKLYRRASRDC
jgi:hypothetical protein